jgi:hypothetical protein
METVLEARGIATEFVEVSDACIYVGYRSHQTDSTDLFNELKLVVTTVLDNEPAMAVTGVIFHTEYLAFGLWHIDKAWAEFHRDGDLSESALLAQILHTLQAVQFQ